MYVVAYETSSLIYHAKPICYVCNRRLFSLSPETNVKFIKLSGVAITMHLQIKSKLCLHVNDTVVNISEFVRCSNSVL